MARYFIDRLLVRKTLRLVREDPKRGVAYVPDDPIIERQMITQMITFIEWVNWARDERERHNEAYDLNQLVRELAAYTSHARALARTHVIIALRFFSQLSSFAAARRRLRRATKEESRARRTARKAALARELSEFKLVG